jgi:hypothetical protein
VYLCCCELRERAWKLKQAKRFVRAVKASKRDVESRAEVGLEWCSSGGLIDGSFSAAGRGSGCHIVTSLPCLVVGGCSRSDVQEAVCLCVPRTRQMYYHRRWHRFDLGQGLGMI